MDKTSQEEVIKKYGRQLQKLSRNIPGNFEVEDIHQWRVVYKKLRAFLRLVVESKNISDQLVSDDFKEIYKIAGSIRNMQLYIISFEDSFPGYLSSIPVYFAEVQRVLFFAKEDFIKKVEQFSFNKEIKKLCEWPPEYLSTERIKSFIQQNVAAIRIALLDTSVDENLHCVRKHLKDVLHNIHSFTTSWGIPFPVTSWKSEKAINDAAEQLGIFMDCCNKVLLIESAYMIGLPSAEEKILQDIQNCWEKERNEQRILVIEKVKALRFSREAKDI